MEKLTPNDHAYFTAHSVNIGRVLALAELLNECARLKVEIEEVGAFQNGYIVCFKGHENADAILHDNSYGHNVNMWETMGFPWDDDDVSVHDAKSLARLVYRLNHHLAL